jgi:hypothetical protein
LFGILGQVLLVSCNLLLCGPRYLVKTQSPFWGGHPVYTAVLYGLQKVVEVVLMKPRRTTFYHHAVIFYDKLDHRFKEVQLISIQSVTRLVLLINISAWKQLLGLMVFTNSMFADILSEVSILRLSFVLQFLSLCL